jgi:hypothetical protein
VARLCVLLLIGSVLWVFGTLPWLAINYLMCSSAATSVCAEPDLFQQRALLILAIDALLMTVSIFSVYYLREMRRHSRK